MSALTEKQIQAQVLSIRRTLKNGARHFALRAPAGWTGPDRLSIDGAEHLLAACVSDLQVREALLRADEEDKPTILLCSVSEDALGKDVINRLAKQKVFAPQLDEMVAELFSVSVKQMDPRVRKSKALMSALLDSAPNDGFPPAASGALDLETAWLALLGCLTGERVESPSLTKWLEWSMAERQRARLAAMSPELKDAFAEWFSRAKGESIQFMLAAMDSGLGSDLVALGAALGLVFDPAHLGSAEHQATRGRLERHFGHREIGAESARAWARAAESILEQMNDEAGIAARRQILNRLDEFLAGLGLSNQAWISNYSPLGLEQRYRDAGRALLQACNARKAPNLEAIRSALALIRRHLLGDADAERFSRVEMAYRLIRWLQTDDSSMASFDAMAVSYHREGGFIDWARNRLKETDEAPEVQKAFAAILKQVEAKAEAFEGAFSLQLSEWTRNESQSDRIILIENVLQEVALPTAKQQPALLLVLDGMSVAVFRQLLQDLLRHDWTEIANNSLNLPRPVIAALPSVTTISRRALFRGRLDPAKSGTEQGDLKGNDLLFQGIGGQVRPQLFKMGDLAGLENEGIPAPVRAAIAEKKCRLVAVVLNAIDDHLDSGKQVDFVWTRNTIRGFRDLLRQASDAGRLVILTSDHGHVLDFGARQLPAAKEGRGDRYRPAEGKLQEGELEFEGSRIYQATGVNRITLACAAGIRYGEPKRGYHGGGNPQEIVAPLAILSDIRAGTPAGWQETPPYLPDWWRMDSTEATPAPAAAAKPAKAMEELDLFERAQTKAPAKGGAWIEALLKSPIYVEQTKLAVRGARSTEHMSKLLAGLDARGGTAVRQALAQDLGMPLFRVDGLIESVSRILNVDGYEVLKFDRGAETVTLNVGLLRTQFELEEAS